MCRQKIMPEAEKSKSCDRSMLFRENATITNKINHLKEVKMHAKTEDAEAMEKRCTAVFLNKLVPHL